MPFDASKVERFPCAGSADFTLGIHHARHVRACNFDACAAALDEARAEVEKLKGIVREYRDSAIGHWPCGHGGVQCFLRKRVDEALGGK